MFISLLQGDRSCWEYCQATAVNVLLANRLAPDLIGIGARSVFYSFSQTFALVSVLAHVATECKRAGPLLSVGRRRDEQQGGRKNEDRSRRLKSHEPTVAKFLRAFTLISVRFGCS
jgi:hypothetical protein